MKVFFDEYMKKINRIKKREEKIRIVKKATGWSREKTITEMNKAKRIGMPYFRYVNNKAWELDEREIELLNSKIEERKQKKKINKKNLVQKEERKQNNAYETEEFFYQILNDGKNGEKYIRINGAKANITDLIIPGKIEDIDVKIIKKEAFKNNKSITNVKVPESINLIGSRAFYGCTALEKIELPSELETINESCFEDCINLKTVVLPYNLKTISNRAFKNCINLAESYHYVKTGIGATMVLDKSLRERKLPSGMQRIGVYAFENCKRIEQVYIPFGIKEIAEGVFKNCLGIKNVFLHNNIKRIDKMAFYGCDNLSALKVSSKTNIDRSAVSDSTEIISEQCKVELGSIDSKMIPDVGNHESKRFYTDEQLNAAINNFELRTPTDRKVDHIKENLEVKRSKFDLIGDKYVFTDPERQGRVKILMTGDLMCRPKQIKAAQRGSGVYDFDMCLKHVEDVLRTGDFVIGNMESMVAHSFPYSNEEAFIDDRVHLNAPEAFLSGIRKAGYDVLINAQNHIYDTGTEGIFETLDAMNRHQLMHTGVVASDKDKRYISVVINGISIAVLSYFDQARQAMKRTNFTTEGLNVLFNNFDEEQIKEDVINAKKDGAEFIVAYCHWGKEYTKKITKRQESFAKMVANAGVDFIFGSHSHCIQPYSVILTEDKRRVPVFYSGGNFLSDISIKMPYVRDSVIVELNLCRNADGNIVIESQGYHPCLIEPDKNAKGQMNTILLNKALKESSYSSERAMNIEESIIRIRQTIGNNKEIVCYIDEQYREYLFSDLFKDEALYSEYKVNDTELLKNLEPVKNELKKEYTLSESNTYRRNFDSSLMEARILCAGQIMYDPELERNAYCFGEYEFLRNFTKIDSCFKDVDFAIGNLVSMVSENAFNMRNFTNLPNIRKGYCNARKEFVQALKAVGFNGFAMANVYNTCLGVGGIFETEKLLIDNGIIPSGIGVNKDPIVEINGIKVAFLSYTIDVFDHANTITSEGADLLLNIYEKTKVLKNIENAKKRGAEFIIVYLNCGNVINKFNLVKRKKIAEETAELGADYIFCTVPYIISKYYKYETQNGKIVPIVSSIGTFISGGNGKKTFSSALINLTIRRTFDNKLEVEDNFIPIEIFNSFDGIKNTVVPVHSYFNPKNEIKDSLQIKEEVALKLGNEIKVNSKRIVTMSSDYSSNFTIEDIYKILNVEPTDKDLEIFGEKYKKAISCIVSRKPDLKENCVAILINYKGNYQQSKIELDIESCKKSKVALVIDNKPHKELPTIVVKEPLKLILQRLAKIVKEKYNPITVAITGSVGKTTIKDMLSEVFDINYKTLHIEGNNNTIFTISQTLQKLERDDEAYIQEIHGGEIGSASNCSKLIEPNIALISNIGTAHISQVGSIEELIKAKLQIIDGLQKDGVLIINNDNEFLKEQKPAVKTIRYSVEDKNCDYYAQNIKYEQNETIFQIVSKGSCDEYGVYDIRLNLRGKHNVSNAVGVFVAARQAKIPPHKIVAGLAHYKAKGIRQNLFEFGGIKFYIDVYNSNPTSLLSAVEVLSCIEKKSSGRRIAIIGEMLELGEKSLQIHYDVGKKISQYNIDILVCIGENAKYIARAAKEMDKKAFYFTNRETFNLFISELIRPDDVVLFKASNGVNLEKATLIPILGNIGRGRLDA